MTSNEALYTLTGLTPVVIKAEEVAKLYNITRNRKAYEIDHEVQPKVWLHPADTVKVTEELDDKYIQIYTVGSKSGHGVWRRNCNIYSERLGTSDKVHTPHSQYL